MSKKEKNRLIHRIRSMNWNNEDEVFDFAVDMGYLSVRLRSEILRRAELDDKKD